MPLPGGVPGRLGRSGGQIGTNGIHVDEAAFQSQWLFAALTEKADEGVGH